MDGTSPTVSGTGQYENWILGCRIKKWRQQKPAILEPQSSQVDSKLREKESRKSTHLMVSCKQRQYAIERKTILLLL